MPNPPIGIRRIRKRKKESSRMMCYDWNRVLGLRVFFTSSHLQAPLSLRLVSSINEATLQTLLLAEVLQVLPVLQVLEVF